MRIEIKNDVHKIAKRLRKTDKNYEIYFNNITKEYELHHKKQREDLGNGLLLILPFETLDKRTIDYVLKTRVQNIDIEHLSERLEKENEKLTLKKQAEAIEKVTYEIKEILSYVNRHSQKEWID